MDFLMALWEHCSVYLHLYDLYIRHLIGRHVSQTKVGYLPEAIVTSDRLGRMKGNWMSPTGYIQLRYLPSRIEFNV